MPTPCPLRGSSPPRRPRDTPPPTRRARPGRSPGSWSWCRWGHGAVFRRGAGSEPRHVRPLAEPPSGPPPVRSKGTRTKRTRTGTGDGGQHREDGAAHDLQALQDRGWSEPAAGRVRAGRAPPGRRRAARASRRCCACRPGTSCCPGPRWLPGRRPVPDAIACPARLGPLARYPSRWPAEARRSLPNHDLAPGRDRPTGPCHSPPRNRPTVSASEGRRLTGACVHGLIPGPPGRPGVRSPHRLGQGRSRAASSAPPCEPRFRRS